MVIETVIDLSTHSKTSLSRAIRDGADSSDLHAVAQECAAGYRFGATEVEPLIFVPSRDQALTS